MTMRIGLLEAWTSDEELEGHRQLRILAEHLGTPLEHFVFNHAPDAAANLPAFLESSVGFLARSPSLVSDPSLAGRLVERVRCGSRLAILASPNYVPDFNRFLLSLGIEITTLGIVKGASSREVEIDRTRCPQSFRDLELFDGVTKLLVPSPRVVRYTGDAIPILTIDDSDAWSVDLCRDLPEDWNAPELACMVATRIGDAGGTVLVIAGAMLADRLVGPEAVEWPGPSANRKFARNLLHFLSRSNVTSTTLEPYELISRIERTLSDIARSVRPKGDPDWWYECVPEPVRKKCAERREQEKGKFPKAAYLDLLDLRSIIESNWKHFEPMLGEVGWRGGKKVALSWFQRLTELRNTVMHPLKGHLGDHRIADDDRSFLADVDMKVRGIYQRMA